MNMQRKSRLVLPFFVLVFIFGQIQVVSVNAQNATRVECGAEIESVFSSDLQVHTYQINVEVGTALVIYVESAAGGYQNLLVDIALSTPTGYVIAEWSLGDSYPYSAVSGAYYRNYVGPTKTVRTDPLSETGNYTIRVIGYTDTGSPYHIYVSCIQPDNTVISSSNMVSGVQCGSIIENEFVWDLEVHRYYLSLQSGDSITLFTEAASANYQNLLVDIALITPRGRTIAEWSLGDSYPYSAVSGAYYRNYVGPTKTVETAPLPETGIYIIAVIGYTDTGSDYIFQAGCVLRDGTVINPGDAPPTNLSDPVVEVGSAPEAGSFSGFGFPGVAPIDFSEGIEIPLQAEQSQTVPIGGDVVLYTYEASANETRTLNITRVSGNISIGITVIKLDTNEIIFFGGMPSSDNLSVELTFPSQGSYTIGLFRVDTVERSNTSGAVQIVLE